MALQPSRDGLHPSSDGLHPSRDGLHLGAMALHPSSDGLLVAMASTRKINMEPENGPLEGLLSSTTSVFQCCCLRWLRASD